MLREALVSLAVASPFPFYWLLWTRPRVWVRLCGAGDACHRMSQVSALLKALQILSLASVSRIAWPPMWALALLCIGQALNLRVYQLLGERGVYYGVRFGTPVPWVTSFPFGYLRDPQYVGSILSLLACSYCVPWFFLALWCSGYLFMMFVESHEDLSTLARPQGPL